MREITVNSDKLKQIRDREHLTQRQLEIKAGVGQGHISKLEGGQRPNAKVATIAALARALRVPVDDLITVPGQGIALIPAETEPELPEFRFYAHHKWQNQPRMKKALLLLHDTLQAYENDLAKARPVAREARRVAEERAVYEEKAVAAPKNHTAERDRRETPTAE